MKNQKRPAATGSNQTSRKRVGQRIVNGLKSFVEALERGEKITEKFTFRKIVLDFRPVQHRAESVKAIRGQLGVSQALFARLLGVKPSTVQVGKHPGKWLVGSLTRFILIQPTGANESQLDYEPTPFPNRELEIDAAKRRYRQIRQRS